METLEVVSPHDKDAHLSIPDRGPIYFTNSLHFLFHQTLSLSLFSSSSIAKKYPSVSSSFSMERASLISSMLEGRGRKRSMAGEEEENSSKSARTSAMERINGFNDTNDLSNISNYRTMMTRSMSMKITEKKDDKLVIIEVINLDEEETENVNSDDTKNKAVEEEEQQPAVNEVVERKGEDDVEMLTLEDWPFPWCSEEAFSWCKGYVCGWYSYWDVMSGEHWLPRAESVEAAWSNDQWMSKDNNECPNP